LIILLVKNVDYPLIPALGITWWVLGGRRPGDDVRKRSITPDIMLSLFQQA